MSQFLRFIGLFLISGFLISFSLPAQEITRIEPPNWWVGMKNSELQLLVYGDSVSELTPSIKAKGISLLKAEEVENPNYLFLYLKIGKDAKPQTIALEFSQNNKRILKKEYQILQREDGSAERQGFSQKDVMYLITPDRFANGDEKNDNIKGMLEIAERSNKDGRHGGDLKGISDHLDYIKNQGFTSIWLNPVLENDQPKYSYHGYATTDFYKIDSRYGSNEEYRNLIKKAKGQGMGMIMDIIVNHCGSKHWWMNDLPTNDWVNHQENVNTDTFIRTNHIKATLQDPYAAPSDVAAFADGWFDINMPDLNQRQPLLAKYLIQNSIWWIEYADLQGIRMDTYPYPHKEFMTDWTCDIMNEYPNFNIVGEEWHINPTIVSFWQADKEDHLSYESCLPSLMDFPLQDALIKALNKKRDGWSEVYSTVALDFQYPHPQNLVIFPDNHDMSRVFTRLNGDQDLLKLAMVYILTMRGTPQIYYGTEILMGNKGTDDHGIIRSDFAGGWKGDSVNAFTEQGLNSDQLAMQSFLKNILDWRKNAAPIHEGKLMHYIPRQSVYVYFRYTDSKKVMVVLSKNEKEATLTLSDFSEMLLGEKGGNDIISGEILKFNSTLKVPAMGAMIIELD